MALIKFGLVVTEARGKLGGHVFTKTKAGAALRTGTSPTNPQTEAQQAVRANFAAMSRLWGTLSREQIDGWNAAAENFKKTNVFGDQFQYSGFNLFVQLNQNLATIGEQPRLTAPASSAPRSGVRMEGLSFTVAAGAVTDINIDYAIRGDIADIMLVITSTAPKSQGVSNFSGMHRIIDVLPSADDGDLIADSYNRKFGVLPVGSRIEVGLYAVDRVSGIRTMPIYYQANVVAPVGP